jgi:hypothetical protein
MSDLDLYTARTQSRITFALIGGFLGLMFALLAIACMPVHVDEKLLAILDRIVTAMLPIVGSAVGFWVARHRPDSNDVDPTQPVAPAQETK